MLSGAPMSDRELTDAEYWDAVWREHAPGKLRAWHPYFGRRGRFLRMVRERVGDLGGARVLEVGAGGTNYRLLALHKWMGARVTAVDYSEVGLDVLRRLFDHNGGEVTCVLGDFLRIDPPPAHDVVVHWGVLEHFEDPVPMLRACRAALTPGGRLLFSMPNLEAWAARWWARFSPDNWSKHILHPEARLRAACEQAGFAWETSFYFGHPAVQMAAWEHRGPIPAVLGVGQRLASAASSVLPLPGVRALSQERGVLARAR